MTRFDERRGRRGARKGTGGATLVRFGEGWPTGGAKALLELARRLDGPSPEARARLAIALERELGAEVFREAPGARRRNKSQ